jgi:orotate phosphoribosyltransferase
MRWDIMPSLQVAQALLEIDAVGFSPQVPVRFKSGILSPVYVDSRFLPYHPTPWHLVIEAFRSVIERESLAFNVIAGVAAGGVPHSSALAYMMRRPSVFIRKEAKEHGTKKLVEGGDVSSRQVLLVEDLVTTGGSSLQAVAVLREEGALVKDALAIVSYGFDEAERAFANAGVRLHTLTNFAQITEEALQMSKFGQAEKDVIQDWFDDPHGWAARHGFA